MAKLQFNPLLKTAHGRVGTAVFRRSWTGKITLIKRADMSNVKWSEAQPAHRQRFKAVVAYAKAALADPTVRARYEQAPQQQGKRQFDIAVSDYFKGKNWVTGSKG